MNRKSLLTLALALIGTSAAFADDITLDPAPFTSTATRAQVNSELSAFRQSGVNPSSKQYNPLAQFRSQRTRADVTADYLSARERVAAFTGEDSGSAYLAARGARQGAEQYAGQPITAQ